MSEARHTPGPWTIEVSRSSIGLVYTGYAHSVVIGNHSVNVDFTRHQNWDHIHTEKLSDGYVRQTGIGRRQPDLTPTPDARLIAAAPTLLEALREAKVQVEILQERLGIKDTGAGTLSIINTALASVEPHTEGVGA